MRFEDYLDQETRNSVCLTYDKAIRRFRRETREMRKLRKRDRNLLLAAVNIWLLIAVLIIGAQGCSTRVESNSIHEVTDDTAIVEPALEPVAPPQIEPVAVDLAGIPDLTERPEELVPEPAEAPMPVEPEPVYYDIKLSCELQDTLRGVCEESGVSFELALSVIWKETNYRNLTGDGGKSYGYMQVQPRWHSDRMEKLGVTDLMDPESNFRVGCDFLSELLSKYPMANALAYYNSGSTRVNSYAEKVMNYMEELV